MTTTLAALTNHQVRLAARPEGLPKASDWQHTSEPVAEPADGGVLDQDADDLARPGDARLDERGQELHPAGGHRRGDARRRHRRRRRVEEPGVRGRRLRQRGHRGAGVRAVRGRSTQAQRHVQDRHAPGHAVAVAQRARHAGHDRLLRADGRRPAEGGRDGRRLRRGRRGRADRRPGRQDQGLPRRRHCRRRGQMRVGREGARLRCLHRLQGRLGQRRA